MYKHQQDPTRVMVIDSHAPVGLILFRFRADGRCWQGLKSVFRIRQDFHELQTFKHDTILSIQSTLVQGHCSNFRQIPDFDLDFDLVKASNRLSS